MQKVLIPVSKEDNYILDTLETPRHFRAFNRNLRGVSIPVGPFHQPLHEQAIYDTDPSKRSEVSQMINLFSTREPRYNANVLEVVECEKTGDWLAHLEWRDRTPPPEMIRITAIMQGKRCIRVVQFGVE